MEDLVIVKTCWTTRLGTVSAGKTLFQRPLPEFSQAVRNVPAEPSVYVFAREAYLHAC